MRIALGGVANSFLVSLRPENFPRGPKGGDLYYQMDPNWGKQPFLFDSNPLDPCWRLFPSGFDEVMESKDKGSLIQQRMNESFFRDPIFTKSNPTIPSIPYQNGIGACTVACVNHAIACGMARQIVRNINPRTPYFTPWMPPSYGTTRILLGKPNTDAGDGVSLLQAIVAPYLIGIYPFTNFGKNDRQLMLDWKTNGPSSMVPRPTVRVREIKRHKTMASVVEALVNEKVLVCQVPFGFNRRVKGVIDHALITKDMFGKPISHVVNIIGCRMHNREWHLELRDHNIMTGDMQNNPTGQYSTPNRVGLISVGLFNRLVRLDRVLCVSYGRVHQ